MDSKLIIAWIAWGLLGSLGLLLHYLIARAFPPLPAGVVRSMIYAQRPPSEESGDGMAEVHALDAALMNAELDRPGSTFWLYYRQPGAVMARSIGSLILSFLTAAWILGLTRVVCGSALVLILGLSLSAHPYLTWWMSRPTLKAS